MSNVLAINLGNSGSTGKIATQIGNEAKMKGFTYYFAYPERRENIPTNNGDLVIIPSFFFRVSRRLDWLFGDPGVFSYFATKKLLKRIKELKIDIIHLHNLHGGFIDLRLLFNYIKKNNLKVIWTLHDCWPFTGRCPHFQVSGCEQWKKGCCKCVYPKNMYPPTAFERAEKTWKVKKELFLGIKDATIVTPSNWLASKVKESFLNPYPVTVIHNGIDLSIFKPTERCFREKIDREIRYVVLGVAFGWSNRKGLDVFIKLAKTLPSCYQIVLVGTNSEIDKILPSNVISVHRTHNQKELADIYSSADVFVNPSREENYPTVNMESLACGTPVLTFKVGGSAEAIDGTCGEAVERDDFDALKNKVIYICENKPFSVNNCVKRAASFDMNSMFKEYVELYEK